MHRLMTAGAAVTIALATPATAQDACGGGGQWIGGDEAQSDITQAETFQEQMALVLGGNQHLSLFTLSADTAVRVEAQGRGNADPQIELIDASGTVILSDDDSGGDGAARAEADLAAGTYCLATSSFDGTPMTAFVRVGRTEQEALTPGLTTEEPETGAVEDDLSQCSVAPDLGTFAGALSGEASVAQTPLWRFTLDAPAAITIRAENEDADPYLTLYDMAQTLIAENDDADGLNARIDISSPLDAGEYCVSVRALSDETLPIAISLGAYDPVAALAALYASGDAAPPLDGSVAVTDLGTIATRLRQDVQVGENAVWYSLSVDSAGLLLIEAISATGDGDPSLVLFDDLGRKLGFNDDAGDGYDSLLAARVNPGTYIVGVREVAAGTESPMRLLFERYVPAP